MSARSSTIKPDGPQAGQIPDVGHTRPGDGDSSAIEVPNRRLPEGAQDEPPTLEAGFNPFRWRRRIRSYLGDYVDWDIKRRKAAIREYLPSDEHKHVAEMIENAVGRIGSSTVNSAFIFFSINVLTTISSILLLFAPPVIVLLVDQYSSGVWVRIGTAALAFAINFVWRSVAINSIYLWVKWRSPQRATKPGRGALAGNPASAVTFPLTVFLLILAIIPAVVAGLPLRLRGMPPWLSVGWLHATFSAVAWAFGAWIIINIGSNMLVRVYWSLFWRRINSRLPEQLFIDRATALIAVSAKNSTDKDAARLLTLIQYVHVMEDISRNFEQYWPRQFRTGYPHVDLAARTWARQVGAAIRAQELPLVIGRHRPVDMSASLARIVANVISKGTFTETPQDDRSYRRAVWWRRLGRPVLAALLLLATAALVFMTVWQPGLPHLLKAWDLTGVANAMSLPDDLRPGVLAGAVAVFGLFVKVIAPSPPDKASDGRPKIYQLCKKIRFRTAFSGRRKLACARDDEAVTWYRQSLAIKHETGGR
jgi:hypothetical protein